MVSWLGLFIDMVGLLDLLIDLVVGWACLLTWLVVLVYWQGLLIGLVYRYGWLVGLVHRYDVFVRRHSWSEGLVRHEWLVVSVPKWGFVLFVLFPNYTHFSNASTGIDGRDRLG